jgi:hypothetical protein
MNSTQMMSPEAVGERARSERGSLGCSAAQPRRVARAVLGPVVAAGALLIAQGAHAKQEYHDALKDETGTCLDCRLCHSEPVGSLASLDATKPFTLTMISGQHLGGLPPPEADSDGDTFTDLVELQSNGDPNDPEIGPGEVKCPELAEYGCIGSKPEAETAPASSSIADTRARFPALLMALATALVLGRRLAFPRR